jgi:hypothetical protein
MDDFHTARANVEKDEIEHRAPAPEVFAGATLAPPARSMMPPFEARAAV